MWMAPQIERADIGKMEDSKKKRILDAATKVIAENGYQYATISTIAKEAGMSTGLLYSYFENKLDLLFSIVVIFLENMNKLNREGLAVLEDPFEKMHLVVDNFESLLAKDEKALYRVKVIADAQPHVVMAKDEKIQEKQKRISAENTEFVETIEGIVRDGQKKGVFDKSLNPSAVRQVVCGAAERVIFGLLYKYRSGEEIGYDAKEGHKTMTKMVDKFLKA
jgi:TetR/AcrR family fatty acid metabolism transcriptional regulator